MKINFLILLMLAILFLNNCTATHKMELTAVASPDQKTDPYGAVVSEKMHVVSMSRYKEIPYMWGNAIFNIIIENGGEEPLTISNENISMIFEGHDKKRTIKELDVLSVTEFMNDIEYEYRKRMLSDLSQIVMVPGFITTWVTRDGATNPADYFPGNSVKFDAEAERAMKKYRSMKKLLEFSPDLILNQKTIMPRESITILISCRTNEIPRGIEGDIEINVSIDGEEHRFTFARK
jgi:hypothetical protein